MHFEVVLYVVLIDILAIISPGPDFFMVLRNTLSHGRRAGFYTTLGITFAGALAFCIALFGIDVVISKNHLLFVILKLIGGLY